MPKKSVHALLVYGQVLLFLAAPALLLGSCAPKPIKIGLPVVLTGLSSRIGVAGRNGALLAMDEINAAGGIKGRPIELLVRDDKDDPDTALAVDQGLVQEGVVALVGHMASRSGTQAAVFATKNQIPLISPTISSTDYSGKDDYFFRIIGSNDLMGRTIAAYARGQGYAKAAAAYESTNASYTVPFYAGFKDEFEKLGGKVLRPHTFATSSSYDYRGLTKGLIAEKPDVVFTVASPFDTASICQGLSLGSSPLPVLACMWAMTDDLFRFGGRSVDRLTGVMYMDSEGTTSAFLAFRAAYVKRYGEEASFASVYGYDALMVLAQALRNSPSLDGPSIKASILELGTFKGLQEDIRIDSYGDCDKRPMVFAAVGGSFHRLP